MINEKTYENTPLPVLITHAVLLLRTVNRYSSKEEQLQLYNKCLTEANRNELIDYIVHFNDPVEVDDEELYDKRPSWSNYWNDSDDCEYTPSATYGDYSPSCPWNAPGMSIRDFI